MSGANLDLRARLRAAVRARIDDLTALGVPAARLRGMTVVELDELKARTMTELMGAPGPRAA